jgi:hypothetical protein
VQISAISEHQKMAILCNDLVRRLSKIHRDVIDQEIEGVIEQYVGQLKSSGFTRKQAKEIVVSGVVGWRRKLERRLKAGQKEYLEARETLDKRIDAHLLEKTNWYKGGKKRKVENKNRQFQYNPPSKRMKQDHHDKKKDPRRTGQERKKVHKANPWARLQCGRDRCLLCDSKQKEGKKNSQDCKKRNFVYETYCRTCQQRQDKEMEYRIGGDKKKIAEEKRKARRYIYVGETNWSVYERGIKHQNDIKACKRSSHMLRMRKKIYIFIHYHSNYKNICSGSQRGSHGRFSL